MDARIDQAVTSGEITEDGTAYKMENNTWIIGDDSEVIVIDPGHDAQAVLDVVGEREVIAVICTHGHPDHIAAAIETAERDEAPIALHPRDLCSGATRTTRSPTSRWRTAGSSRWPTPGWR